VNEVGKSHTFTVLVQQDDGLTAAQGGDGVTGFAPVSGAKPTVTLTDSGGAVHSGVTDTCASTGTNSSGQCTVTFTSNSAGIVTGHASVTFSVGGVSLTRSTNATPPNTGDVTKRFVDAKITITPNGVNEVGTTHTFTILDQPN